MASEFAPAFASREAALMGGGAFVNAIVGDRRDDGGAAPRVEILDDARPVAYAERDDAGVVVAVSTGLLTTLDAGAVDFVVRHEAAHVAQGATVGRALLIGGAGMGAAHRTALVEHLRRLRESDADDRAIEAGADPAAAIRTFAAGQMAAQVADATSAERTAREDRARTHELPASRVARMAVKTSGQRRISVAAQVLESLEAAAVVAEAGALAAAESMLRLTYAESLVVGAPTTDLERLEGGLRALLSRQGLALEHFDPDVPITSDERQELESDVADTEQAVARRVASAVRLARESDLHISDKWYDVGIDLVTRAPGAADLKVRALLAERRLARNADRGVM